MKKIIVLLFLICAIPLSACSKAPEQIPAPTVQRLTSPLELSEDEAAIAIRLRPAPFIIPTICFTGIIRTGPPSSFPFPPRPISSPPFWTGPMFCTWTMKPWSPASNGL